MNQPWGQQIRACVFDAYGTLFDVHSAVGKHRSRLGEHADRVSQLWRTKQLEYTWLRSLMGQYRDFWQVTQDALDFAFATYGVSEPDSATISCRRIFSWTVIQKSQKRSNSSKNEAIARRFCRMALPRCLPQPLPTLAFLTASTRPFLSRL